MFMFVQSMIAIDITHTVNTETESKPNSILMELINAA